MFIKLVSRPTVQRESKMQKRKKCQKKTTEKQTETDSVINPNCMEVKCYLIVLGGDRGKISHVSVFTSLLVKSIYFDFD